MILSKIAHLYKPANQEGESMADITKQQSIKKSFFDKLIDIFSRILGIFLIISVLLFWLSSPFLFIFTEIKAMRLLLGDISGIFALLFGIFLVWATGKEKPKT